MWQKFYALLVQLVETFALEAKGYRFESYVVHQVRSLKWDEKEGEVIGSIPVLTPQGVR